MDKNTKNDKKYLALFGASLVFFAPTLIVSIIYYYDDSYSVDLSLDFAVISFILMVYGLVMFFKERKKK